MFKIAGGLFVAIVLFGIVIMGGNLLLQPMRVVNKTFDADNMIQKYEWFYDAYGNYKAKVSQVKEHKGLQADEKDPREASMLRMETSAIKQSCRDLAQRYNANAEKANQSIFMGRDVPSKVNAGDCE